MMSIIAARLFLFPHQDDEFAVFDLLENCGEDGVVPLCVFLTCSPCGSGATAIRNSESMRVLRRLGVGDDRILFVGENLGVVDCRVSDRMGVIADWLHDFLVSHEEISEIFIPAWEGGHPDHDSVHALVLSVAVRLNRAVKILQYPLYNGRGVPGGMFRIISPLPENGPCCFRDVSAWRRVCFLALCFQYRSQWRSWIGLFPALVWRYIRNDHLALQETEIFRVHEPPHAGPLYYERRGFARWDVLGPKISRFTREWRPSGSLDALSESGK
ncbi:PIG-L deacetylase family protein [Uliginosibacterium flavum]|uniref:PIG-L family deacetylase n=1 Tax=Uliginosibacterium flavum TaxID=1396831 RepID=A0ABV2TM51_9RHOO